MMAFIPEGKSLPVEEDQAVVQPLALHQRNKGSAMLEVQSNG